MAEKRENRITIPATIRARAEQRAADLGYGSLIDYVVELVVIDTSPLIAHGVASVPETPQQQHQPSIAVTAGGGWGAEV